MRYPVRSTQETTAMSNPFQQKETPTMEKAYSTRFNPLKALGFACKETALLVKDLFDYRGEEKVGAGASTCKLPPSFTKMMRVKEYNREDGLFYMDNGTPVAMFEIKGLSTEGLSEARMAEWEQLVFDILGTFPPFLAKDNPWMVQMYCKDEHDLTGLYHEIEQSINPEIKKTKLSQAFLKMFKEHCYYLTQPQGIFHDQSTQTGFSGKRRVTRLVFYRKNSKKTQAQLTKETLRLANKLKTTLSSNMAYGMTFKQMDDYAYFLWLFNKFHLEKKGYERPSSYLQSQPFVEDEKQRVYGYDFTEEAVCDPVHSDAKNRHWKIGETYHQYISCLGLRRAPEIGAVTAEREISGVQQAWFDSLPSGSEFHMSFEVVDKFDIQQMMAKKEKSAKKETSADAEKTVLEVDYFQREIENKNYLYPMQAGCFISATTLEQLEENADSVSSALESLRFEVLREEYDINRLDKWVRFLPANYQRSYDNYYNTAKFTTARHIARLAPIGYGRISGSSNPLIVNFNRNGEPMKYDSIKNRTQNMHKLTLGNTGSGKSIAAAMELFHVMAIHRPYLTIVEAGKSFEFVVDFLEYLGCSVNRIIVQSSNKLPPVSLNPFSETKQLVNQLAQMELLDAQIDEQIAQRQAKNNQNNQNNKKGQKNKEGKAGVIDQIINDVTRRVDESINEANHAIKEEKHNVDKALDYLASPEKAQAEESQIQRDYLADFLLAALIIAGEGKDPDEVGFDVMYKHELLESIIDTAKAVVSDPDNPNDNQLLMSDIRDDLQAKTQALMASDNLLDQERVVRLNRLQKGFDSFLKSTLNRMYFNTPSQGMSASDITYFEMGIWKDDKDSNIAPRTLAFITMMNRVMADCEARQKSGRLHILAADECHIVTTKKATAASVTQCSKMARKVGLGLWFYTQNVKDFKDNAAKMLSNFETWQLLKLPDEELERIAGFVNLDERQKALVRSIRVQKGAYSESVIISPLYQFLSRCVPCREILYMAMNEPEEKNKRLAIMNFFKVSEPVAAVIQSQVVKGQSINLYQIYQMMGIESPVPEMPVIDEEKLMHIKKEWC